MRSLVLAALFCMCLGFPSLDVSQRKGKGTENSPNKDIERPVQDYKSEESSGDNPQTQPSWFDNVNQLNPKIFLHGRYIIRMDVASRLQRSAYYCSYGACLWPASENGIVTVPYNISSDFSYYDKIVITSSLRDIEEGTCIRFKEWTSEIHYLNIVSAKGCWSAIGMNGGAQTISLERPGCIWSGTVTHEVLHSLGLNHEHVREDRDNYIKVIWERIQSGSESNFQKTGTYNMDLSTYDYQSIMHYPNKAFSNDGISPTLVAVSNANMNFGEQLALTALDFQKLNTLYKCKGTTLPAYVLAKSDINKTPAILIPTTTTKSTTTTTKSTTTTTTTQLTRTTPKSTTTTKPTTTTTRPTTTTTKSTTTTTRPTTMTTTTTRPRPLNPTTADNGCGGNLMASRGMITSPNYPKDYFNNGFCHWNITTTGKFIVTFLDLDVEGDGKMCAFDKLKIYNGREFNTLYQLKDICGKKLPPPIVSYENTMQIVLITDSSATGKGFSLVYQPV